MNFGFIACREFLLHVQCLASYLDDVCGELETCRHPGFRRSPAAVKFAPAWPVMPPAG
ncbi:hypothetical protein [Nocardia sp. NPDC004711]